MVRLDVMKNYTGIVKSSRNKIHIHLIRISVFVMILIGLSSRLSAQQHHHSSIANEDSGLAEDDYYKIIDVPMPKHVLPEVGGLTMMPDGRLVMVTRRGEVWIIKDPSGKKPEFKLYASGLHEPLGVSYKDNALFVAQRAELSKLSDTNKDDRIDRFEKLTGWPLSGNYCEYNHGPVIGNDGNFYINMNLGDNGMGAGAEKFYGEMGSHANWRGWMMKVTPEGVMTPYAAGLRSPAGIGLNEKGEVFYTENQGGWVGTGYISHVSEGDFFGHPSSLKSAGLPGSPVHLTIQDIPRDEPLFHEAVKEVKGLKMPSVRIPHGILGISTAGFVVDKDGAMGPFFKDQFFIGDEGHAKIIRVSMEKVNGQYQGAVYPFRDGFESGILRMEWGNDQSLFVGMSDRGWNSTGRKREGLQRLVWNKKVPFEIQSIKAKSDGFEIHFTLPADSASLVDPANYAIAGFDYLYHQTYGSDVMDKQDGVITAILVGEDSKTVRLVVDGLREGYIHELKLDGIRSKENNRPLLHDFAYYSLNSIPKGDQLSLSAPGVIDVSKQEKQAAEPGVKENKVPAVKVQTKASEGKVEKRVNVMPKSWDKADRTIVIGTKPGLKFDVESFNLKPGERVKLVFKNVDDMQHNLLIVAPSFVDEVGKQALKLGLDGPKMNYVPKNDHVLFHTGLLQPRSEEAIYFTAPTQEGKYEYVCTYPGHYFVMRGVMNVKK